MMDERVEHVLGRDHVTADQQFGLAHRWRSQEQRPSRGHRLRDDKRHRDTRY